MVRPLEQHGRLLHPARTVRMSRPRTAGIHNARTGPRFAHPSDARRPLTIVWCEDGPSVVDLLERVWFLGGELAHPADQLLFTPDGEQALAWVDAHGADFLVTDEWHPRGPLGHELLREAARHPTLALGHFSGYLDERIDAEQLDFLLTKPADLWRLVSALTDVTRPLRAGTYRPRRLR